MIKSLFKSFFISITVLLIPAKIFAGVTVINESSSKSTTDVKIETNGEVKTFHSEGNQNVNWTSDDGKSTVVINNNSNNKSAIDIVSKGIEKSEESREESIITSSPSGTTTPIDERIQLQDVDILEILKERVESIWRYLFHRSE